MFGSYLLVAQGGDGDDVYTVKEDANVSIQQLGEAALSSNYWMEPHELVAVICGAVKDNKTTRLHHRSSADWASVNLKVSIA